MAKSEGYQPREHEMKWAEEQMTPEQKRASALREENLEFKNLSYEYLQYSNNKGEGEPCSAKGAIKGHEIEVRKQFVGDFGRYNIEGTIDGNTMTQGDASKLWGFIMAHQERPTHYRCEFTGMRPSDRTLLEKSAVKDAVRSVEIIDEEAKRKKQAKSEGEQNGEKESAPYSSALEDILGKE